MTSTYACFKKYLKNQLAKDDIFSKKTTSFGSSTHACFEKRLKYAFVRVRNSITKHVKKVSLHIHVLKKTKLPNGTYHHFSQKGGLAEISDLVLN